MLIKLGSSNGYTVYHLGRLKQLNLDKDDQTGQFTIDTQLESDGGG